MASVLTGARLRDAIAAAEIVHLSWSDPDHWPLVPSLPAFETANSVQVALAAGWIARGNDGWLVPGPVALPDLDAQPDGIAVCRATGERSRVA